MFGETLKSSYLCYVANEQRNTLTVDSTTPVKQA